MAADTSHGFGLGRVSAVMAVGVFALMIAGIQPVVLGALQLAGRITVSQIGVAATFELLALGLMSAIAESIFSVRYLRSIGISAGICLTALNLFSAFVVGWEFILVRAAAGLAAGVLLWITAGLVARSKAPERAAAIFLTTQTLAQLGGAALLPLIGVDGKPDLGLWFLAAMALLATVSCLGIPSAYAPLGRTSEEGGRAPLSLASFVTLILVVAQVAFVLGIWVYMDPLVRLSGLSPEIGAFAVAVGLGAQVVGGLVAMVVPSKVTPRDVFLVAGLIDLVLLAIFARHPGAPLFFITVFVFGFLWLFVMPFQTLMAINVDPSRRAAMLVPFAQLLGASLGPFVASMAVREDDMNSVLLLGGGWVAVWFAGLLWLHMTRRNSRRHRGPDGMGPVRTLDQGPRQLSDRDALHGTAHVQNPAARESPSIGPGESGT
jgi:MFS transporter, DHA1 family, inner membrane transport protein